MRRQDDAPAQMVEACRSGRDAMEALDMKTARIGGCHSTGSGSGFLIRFLRACPYNLSLSVTMRLGRRIIDAGMGGRPSGRADKGIS